MRVQMAERWARAVLLLPSALWGGCPAPAARACWLLARSSSLGTAPPTLSVMGQPSLGCLRYAGPSCHSFPGPSSSTRTPGLVPRSAGFSLPATWVNFSTSPASLLSSAWVCWISATLFAKKGLSEAPACCKAVARGVGFGELQGKV